MVGTNYLVSLNSGGGGETMSVQDPNNKQIAWATIGTAYSFGENDWTMLFSFTPTIAGNYMIIVARQPEWGNTSRAGVAHPRRPAPAN